MCASHLIHGSLGPPESTTQTAFRSVPPFFARPQKMEGSIVFVRWRQCALMGGEGTWRHLANTIESSVCGGDAALCKITLTSC